MILGIKDGSVLVELADRMSLAGIASGNSSSNSSARRVNTGRMIRYRTIRTMRPNVNPLHLIFLICASEEMDFYSTRPQNEIDIAGL
jgi:hypothetical protein